MTLRPPAIRPRWRWTGPVPRLAANAGGVAIIENWTARSLAWADGHAQWSFPLPVGEVLTTPDYVLASGNQNETFVIDSKSGGLERLLPNVSGSLLGTDGPVLFQCGDGFLQTDPFVSATDVRTARTLWRMRWHKMPFREGWALCTVGKNRLFLRHGQEPIVHAFYSRTGAKAWSAPGHLSAIVDEEHGCLSRWAGRKVMVDAVRLSDGSKGRKLRVGGGGLFAGGRHHSVREERGRVVYEVNDPFTGKGRRSVIEAPIDELRNKPLSKAPIRDEWLYGSDERIERLRLRYADQAIVLLRTKRPQRLLCARANGEVVAFLELSSEASDFYRQGRYLLARGHFGLDCFELDIRT